MSEITPQTSEDNRMDYTDNLKTQKPDSQSEEKIGLGVEYEIVNESSINSKNVDSFIVPEIKFSEIGGNPEEFINNLRNQFGSTEEFCQFERHFYAQGEELRMLRENIETFRSAYVKIQEERRKLELQLVSEKASREQDSKNALTEFENNTMQLNTKIYSMTCEVETWKRKAEATLKESGWLKQQLKSLEMEKTDAVRKVGDFTRQNSGIEQYRISIEAYARRQRETMNDVQARLVDVEKAREDLASLMEHNRKQMNYMAVHLRNQEKASLMSEKRISELEQEIIKVKAELVQNGTELARVKIIEGKATKLMDELIVENKDLHCGLNLLVSSMDDQIGETSDHFIKSIQQLHTKVEESVKKLHIDN